MLLKAGFPLGHKKSRHTGSIFKPVEKFVGKVTAASEPIHSFFVFLHHCYMDSHHVQATGCFLTQQLNPFPNNKF